MYQTTLTLNGKVIVQEILNRENAKSLWDKFSVLKEEEWNINILKLIVDESFNLKEEFL
jgi:hypothetical protein